METSRVVMIRYNDGGVRRWGSGLRIGGKKVLTAEHVARGTGYTVVTDAGELRAEVLCRSGDLAVDLAVLNVPDAKSVAWMECALVDQGTVSTIRGCVALGFPTFMQNDGHKPRTVQVDGFIPTAEGVRAVLGRGLEHGHLSLKAEGPAIGHQPTLPDGTLEGTPWAGMSGAVVVSGADQILGVIRHHNGAQGVGTLGLTPLDAIELLPEPLRSELWAALGVTDPHGLTLLSGRTEPVEPLANLVEVFAGTELPLVRDLDSYRLGATRSTYGGPGDTGAHDPYVPRTHNNVDTRLKEALTPGRMVLLVGPSKAGKTRTAFHSMLAQWPQAAVLVPTPQGLAGLARHPRLRQSTDPLIIWLDDLQKYLLGIPEPLTTALLTSLVRIRPGSTMVVSTLRAEERARLSEGTGELTREVRQVLEAATTVELDPTSTHPEEQAAARAAYPGEDLSVYGLAEQLAGAPALLLRYHDARHANPLLHAVIQTAIDWARVGVPGPVPEEDLVVLSITTLFRDHSHIRPTAKKIEKTIVTASTPPPGAGRVAALGTVGLPGQRRGYHPFSYLVAADDGQTGQPRPIPDNIWDEVIERTNPSTGLAIGVAAYQRDNTAVARRSWEKAANAGDTDAMYNLGYLLTELDPPQTDAARRWYKKAARAGNTGAMNNLGYLLARLDPPQTDAARRLYEKAARAGNTNAMNGLGALLMELNPPQTDTARTWWDKAARAGHADAMTNLGLLLARLDPPETDTARSWWEKAARAGHADAMFNLGYLLARLDPPETDTARSWWEKAAQAGYASAMNNLGALLTELDPPETDTAHPT